MKASSVFSLKKAKCLPLFAFAALQVFQAEAQAPTSLNYPTPNVYITNVSSVYLAPTVAGNVTSYSISPALPSGLSFNTNTGLITGTPLAASSATNYVITATGGSPSGSTTDTVNIKVTNNYFDNNFANINFGGPGVTITLKDGGSNTSAGSTVLYENVAVLSGQQIDAVVKVRSLNGTYSVYDQTSPSGTGYSSNQERFFSPFFSFGSSGGSCAFDFQFIYGGSYNDATKTGTPVVLQNVRINTYDVDGNGNNNSNQYNEFGGFNTSELSYGTHITPTFNSTSGLTKFRSDTKDNSSVVTDDSTRVRVTYNNISDFSIVVGAEGTGSAYFFLDFGAGPAFATAVPVQAPSVDLNTNQVGVNNAGAGCSSALTFTPSGQTNISASPATLNEFSISFPTAAIQNGASEKLLINGASSGGSIALNFANLASITDVAMSGITYDVNASVSSGVSKLSFTKAGGGTMTLTQAEALLDALQYNNVAASPVNGDRVFTVNVRNDVFRSPDAKYTVSLNCVGISGNIYHDVNGLTDNTVNANGTQFGAGYVYAVLVDPAADTVIGTRAIAAGGAYNFGNVQAGTYLIYTSSTNPAVGSAFTAPTYPSGTSGAYRSTGENLGAAAGNDLAVDGKLRVTVGSISVTDANFGIQLPPVVTNKSYTNVPNPGGFNNYTLPNGSFNATDEDGNVTSITITAFPTGANYLKVGSTVYTSGGTCPPQSSCTAWPGSVTVPFSGGNPTQSISVDPVQDGNTSVSLSFTALDNGGFVSNSGTVSVDFVGTSYYNISGLVWNDANGDGNQNGVEERTSVADGGQTLYAVLVQNNNTYSGAPTILASTAVNSTSGYSFANVPAGNNYEVRIVSRATAPMAGAAFSTFVPHLATGWVGVSTDNNGTLTTGLNTSNPVNTIANLSSNRNNINFGIEQVPVADNKSFSAPNGAFTKTPSITIGGLASFGINGANAQLTGSSVKSLSGNDPEDCAAASSCNTGKTYIVKTIQSNTRLFYDFGAGAVEVTPSTNNTIANFDPSKLTIYGKSGEGYTDATALGFTYSLVDNAGIQSAPASYKLKSSSAALPVVLKSFAGVVNNCVATLRWESASEANNSHYVAEQSADGISYAAVAQVKSRNSASGASYAVTVPNLQAGSYFRLKMVDLNGAAEYSPVVRLNAGECTAAVSVWPNPAADVVNVSGLSAQGYTVRVYNGTGALVRSITGHESSVQFSMADLASGAYLVQVLNSDGSQSAVVRLIRK